MTRHIAISSLFIGVATLLLPPSMASAEMTGACLSDAKTLCGGVQPGGGKIRACLKTHLKELSEDCEALALKAVNAKACADDAKQFCADVKPGDERLKDCIKSHVAELDDACKVALANSAAGED